MEATDTLWHINWGDNDNFYVIALSKHKAIGMMQDGKDMVNYAVRLDRTYERIFKAGLKEVVDWIRTNYVTDEYGCYRIPDKVIQAKLKE